ncbi:nitronate monooxygenase [Streptomyces sp. NPDC001312]|uniref:nitronate monooxygenase n=1 Tax=Streptomyces sp. NPDC001312 TaxID=3364561 RepID=UPI003678931C
MGLSTAFTELFGVEHPIALAPMGGSAGGALAAAVSRGGGLGLLGSGNGDREWLARELPVLAGACAGKPWGIGFQTWAIDDAAIARALEHGPAAVMLSFGDPGPFAERVRGAGTALILQVTDLEEAHRAVDLGADVIVTQGTEAGGHGARHGRSTLPFVPVVADLAAPLPVLAAGGIADGRGVAAALALGPPEHCSAPASRPPPRPWSPPRQAGRSSRVAGRTPSATGCWTSPVVRGGRRSTPRAP